jgi:hypothetical protein
MSVLVLIQNDDMCIETATLVSKTVLKMFHQFADYDEEEMLESVVEDVRGACDLINAVRAAGGGKSDDAATNLRTTLAVNIIQENKGNIDSGSRTLKSLDKVEAEIAATNAIIVPHFQPFARDVLNNLHDHVLFRMFFCEDTLRQVLEEGRDSAQLIVILAHGDDNGDIGNIAPAKWKQLLSVVSNLAAIDVVACISAKVPAPTVSNIWQVKKSAVQRMKMKGIPIRGRLTDIGEMHALTSMTMFCAYGIAIFCYGKSDLPMQDATIPKERALFKLTTTATDSIRGQVGRAALEIVIHDD